MIHIAWDEPIYREIALSTSQFRGAFFNWIGRKLINTKTKDYLRESVLLALRCYVHLIFELFLNSLVLLSYVLVNSKLSHNWLSGHGPLTRLSRGVRLRQ